MKIIVQRNLKRQIHTYYNMEEYITGENRRPGSGVRLHVLGQDRGTHPQNEARQVRPPASDYLQTCH